MVLETVTAIRFDRVMSSGRTRPCLVNCVKDNGNEIEVILKFKAGCDWGFRSLMNEALAALLACELGLPIPTAFVVNIDKDFAETIPDNDAKALALKSIGLNFGSVKLPPGFITIPKDIKLKKPLIQTAAEILAFDVFIENADRRISNPNLLLNGKSLAIYDHELAFGFDLLIGWKPLWEEGAIRQFPLSEHVLYRSIRGKNLDFGRIENALNTLTSKRLREFGQALPHSWIDEGVALDRILSYIEQLASHSSLAIKQLEGVLR